jgi:hypothetical protein
MPHWGPEVFVALLGPQLLLTVHEDAVESRGNRGMKVPPYLQASMLHSVPQNLDLTTALEGYQNCVARVSGPPISHGLLVKNIILRFKKSKSSK